MIQNHASTWVRVTGSGPDQFEAWERHDRVSSAKNETKLLLHSPTMGLVLSLSHQVCDGWAGARKKACCKTFFCFYDRPLIHSVTASSKQKMRQEMLGTIKYIDSTPTRLARLGLSLTQWESQSKSETRSAAGPWQKILRRTDSEI